MIKYFFISYTIHDKGFFEATVQADDFEYFSIRSIKCMIANHMELHPKKISIISFQEISKETYEDYSDERIPDSTGYMPQA